MDTKRNELFENYEGALFALLMHDRMHEEGARLIEENENLKNDSDFIVPDSFKDAGLKAIKEAFSAKKRKKAARIAGFVLKKAAVFVLLIGTGFSVLFFSVEAFRTRVMNMYLEAYETHTQVGFTNTDGASDNMEAEISVQASLPQWIPAGYALSYSEDLDGNIAAEYYDNMGNYIYFNVYSAYNTLNIDTEDADIVSEININGNEGLLAEKEQWVRLIWCAEEKERIIILYTDGLSAEDVIKIAESVEIQ